MTKYTVFLSICILFCCCLCAVAVVLLLCGASVTITNSVCKPGHIREENTIIITHFKTMQVQMV